MIMINLGCPNGTVLVGDLCDVGVGIYASLDSSPSFCRQCQNHRAGKKIVMMPVVVSFATSPLSAEIISPFAKSGQPQMYI